MIRGWLRFINIVHIKPIQANTQPSSDTEYASQVELNSCYQAESGCAIMDIIWPGKLQQQSHTKSFYIVSLTPVGVLVNMFCRCGDVIHMCTYVFVVCEYRHTGPHLPSISPYIISAPLLSIYEDI